MKEMMLKMAFPIILGLVKDMLTPENFHVYGKALFGLMRKFVLDTKTKADDKLCLPLIDAAETAIWPEDNK